MKPWEEVQISPEFKSLSGEDKEIAKKQYDSEYVIHSKWKSISDKPEFKKLPKDQQKLAQEQFMMESDPAYQMSVPSKDPKDMLGYYQWANTPIADPESPYGRALEHPLRREGFNPRYDVFVPPSYDPLNMGARSQMWGAVLPSGMNWRTAKDRLEGTDTLNEKSAKAIYKYLSEGEMDEDTRSELKYSDQTAYFNQAVQSQDRPSTVPHESTHRGITKMADKVWGPGYLPLKTNMLMTRVMDYKYGNETARKAAIPFIEGLSTDRTLEGGINEVLPLINELTNAVTGDLNEK